MCPWWLHAELEAIRPAIIVLLGATAAQLLLGRNFRLTQHFGEFQETPWTEWTLATYHPSAISARADAELRRHAAAVHRRYETGGKAVGEARGIKRWCTDLAWRRSNPARSLLPQPACDGCLAMKCAYEYDFSKGVRGKHYRYREGHVVRVSTTRGQVPRHATSIRVEKMKQGWSGDDYLIVFDAAESERMTEAYGIRDFLPDATIIAIHGWDDFIIRNAKGQLFQVPTLPLDTLHMTAFRRKLNIANLVADSRFTDKVKWYVNPIVFGGDPEIGDNIIWIDLETHQELVRWWNRKYADVTVKTTPERPGRQAVRSKNRRSPQ